MIDPLKVDAVCVIGMRTIGRRLSVQAVGLPIHIPNSLSSFQDSPERTYLYFCKILGHPIYRCCVT